MRNFTQALIVTVTCSAALGLGAASASAQSSFPILPAIQPPALPQIGQLSSRPLPAGGFQAQDEARLIQLLNDYRASHGLAPVRADLGLTLRAREWSQEQALRGSLRHSGDNVWEVLAYNNFTTDPAHFLDQWKRSPEHNRALLEPRARTAGYGTASSPRGFYATLQMG